jgi:hypothetical protein
MHSRRSIHSRSFGSSCVVHYVPSCHFYKAENACPYLSMVCMQTAAVDEAMNMRVWGAVFSLSRLRLKLLKSVRHVLYHRVQSWVLCPGITASVDSKIFLTHNLELGIAGSVGGRVTKERKAIVFVLLWHQVNHPHWSFFRGLQPQKALSMRNLAEATHCSETLRMLNISLCFSL